MQEKSISLNPLFFNSLLLFSDENMCRIKNAKIAVAGIGGVGSIAVELLVRQGVGNVKISDVDIYSEENLNRQIFATTDSIGVNKAIVAKERILKINPNCKVEVFEGINKNNAEDFLKNVDILLLQVDKESIKVLLHKIAKKNGIPVICGSRSSLEESRWCVTAKLWDYKNKPALPCYDITNHPELVKYEINELTDKILNDYDEKIKDKKKKIFRQNVKNNADLFKSISEADLLKRLENNDNFYNRHVCAIVANTAGCFAVTSCIRYILGNPVEILKQDLW